jgi:methylglutaconyl-CoA hydratase
MTASLVSYNLHAPAVVLTLNRSEKRNALNRQLINDIRAAFTLAADDNQVRVVILTGAGPVFCAGMDLSELSQTLDEPDEAALVHEDANRLSDLYEFIYSLPKPTIAAVNGPAVAGGAGLLTVCDLALATTAAKFGYPEVRRGLVAAMVMPHLMRHVGERAARDLLLRGELVDAATALRIGLINEVVPADQLISTAVTWSRQLAEGSPGSLRMTKELLQRFDPGLRVKAEYAKGSADARLTVECKEGLRAFLNKQPAPWAK